MSKSKPFDGFKGMPLLWNLSGIWKFSNGATWTSKCAFSKTWMLTHTWETPSVNNMKLTYNMQGDLKKALFSPKELLLTNGVSVELKM